MHTIECVGRDGEKRRFEFDDPSVQHQADGRTKYSYRVWSTERGCRSFDVDLREKADGELQVVSITHYGDPKYVAMGIPEVLLPHLARRHGVRICSSRSIASAGADGAAGAADLRSDDADKMWKRLVCRGFARYFAEEDVYRTVAAT